jgi:hypothetical protein
MTKTRGPLARGSRAALAILDNEWVGRVGSAQALVWLGGLIAGTALVLYAAVKALIRGGFDPASIILLALGIVVLAALAYIRVTPPPAESTPSLASASAQTGRRTHEAEPSLEIPTVAEQLGASGATTAREEPDLLLAALDLEDDIETLRRRIAQSIPRMVYWRDLLARGVFEEHRRTLMQRPAVFKAVSDAYRWFHELNQATPLDTPIGADQLEPLNAGLRQVADASGALRDLIVELADDSGEPRQRAAGETPHDVAEPHIPAGEDQIDDTRLVRTIDQMDATFQAMRNGLLRGEHARIYGAVLDATKAARPDDPFVALLTKPEETAMSGIFKTTVAEARTGLEIMRSALAGARNP